MPMTKLIKLKLTWLLCGYLIVFSGSASATPSDDQCWTLMSQGKKVLAANDLHRALAIFKQAQQVNPTDARPFFWLGLTLDQLGDLKGAVQAYADCLDLAKQRNLDCPELRIDLGNVLCKLNYFKQAVYDYQRALEINPSLTVVHMYLAKALIDSGQYQEAMGQLDLYSRLSIKDPTIPYLRALALKGLGNSGAALTQAQDFLDALPAEMLNTPLAQKGRLLEVELKRQTSVP